jgi:DNA-binding CsgD family transcriptional regulator
MTTRQKCASLFRRGMREAAIARELGLDPATVSQYLRSLRLDPARRRADVERAERERFIKAWNAAGNLDALAAAEGSTPEQVGWKAARLRRLGCTLKWMPGRRKAGPGVTAAKIRRLHGQGFPRSEIARQLGVSRQYVHQVVSRLAKDA